MVRGPAQRRDLRVTRCQVCARRIGLTRFGAIRHHHVRSEVCPGAGFPPIEQEDSRLETVLREIEAREAELTGQLRALYDARANYIDPALTRAISEALSAARRLERRLSRHRAWPERFRRQMERQGWGDPPPQYLVDRQAGAPDAQLRT